MAVVFKGASASTEELIGLLGVSKTLISKAKSYGVVINQSSPGTFVVSVGGNGVGVIPIKGQAITLAYEGNLGPASKQALEFQFTQVLEKAIKMAPELPVTPVADKVLTGGVQLMANGGTVPAPSKHFWTPGKYSIDPYEDNTVVPLVEAKYIGQQVLGTSAGSIYVVFALFDGMPMALRRVGSKLSLRAEGNIKAYGAGLISVGFELHEGYSSVHLNITDPMLLRKTLGAVLGAVGLSHVISVGNIDELVASCKK